MNPKFGLLPFWTASLEDYFLKGANAKTWLDVSPAESYHQNYLNLTGPFLSQYHKAMPSPTKVAHASIHNNAFSIFGQTNRVGIEMNKAEDLIKKLEYEMSHININNMFPLLRITGFDCCGQSLKSVSHPPDQPSFHPLVAPILIYLHAFHATLRWYWGDAHPKA